MILPFIEGGDARDPPSEGAQGFETGGGGGYCFGQIAKNKIRTVFTNPPCS